MGPEFHSDLYKLPGNLISLWNVLLRLLFVVFSAILMTLSPRGWNPRKQKDADSLSDSIKCPVNSPCLNQYPQLLHAELQWKEQHKATSRNLKVFEGKQAEISHKLMVWFDHTTIFFFPSLSWEALKIHHWACSHFLDQSYVYLSYLHFCFFHNT